MLQLSPSCHGSIGIQFFFIFFFGHIKELAFDMEDCRYVSGKKPPGAESLDQARMKLTGKAREMKDRAEQYAGQQTS